MTDNNSIIPNFDDEWDKSLKITITDEPKLPGVLQVYLKGSIDNYNTSFFENKLNKKERTWPWTKNYYASYPQYLSH